MKEFIKHRLQSHFTSASIEQEIHSVPPHRVYEVRVDGQRAICKLDTGPTGSAEREGRIMAFVEQHSTVPVPEILAVGESYFVAAWHPEAPAAGASPDPTETWATGAGAGLATLHRDTGSALDRYGRFVPQDDTVAVEGGRSWQAAALAYIERHRPVLGRYRHDDMAELAHEVLAGRPGLFEEAGDPVCCHGWYSPEHASIGADGQLACLVDFEHALAAPPAFDYWRAVVASFGPGEPTPARRAFRRGYESVRPLGDGFDERKPLYDVLNLVYFFESLYVQNQHDPDETEARAEHMRTLLTEKLDALR